MQKKILQTNRIHFLYPIHTSAQDTYLKSLDLDVESLKRKRTLCM